MKSTWTRFSRVSRKRRGIDLTEQLKKDGGYTYADYLTWDDEVRYEIIDGIVYMMSPGPNMPHQQISISLLTQISNFLKGKNCRVFHAPFDVRLDPEGGDKTVVQPDIIVVCDPLKLNKKGCVGAPDMVVEILSPSTSNKDKTIKFNKYLESGVKEYWIIDPRDRTLITHILKDGVYITVPYEHDKTAPVTVLEGLEIDLAEVFEGIEEEKED